jgi:hypothetical protein
VTKVQKALLVEFDKLNAEWPDASGERRGELQVLIEEMRRRSDVAAALGERSAALQAKRPVA